ncbi:protein kinase [Streptomyces sp. NPDC004610]|uniref:phosphotransferase family protein n=1 Tax=unclassified Streptomyces TaxID=2593676 RepID=UPI0033AF791C
MSAEPEPESEIRALIRPHTGVVHDIRRTVRGFSTDLTARVDAVKGRFFVKAVRNRPGGRADSFAREALINPSVRQFSPRLLWEAEDARWIVLGFEWVEARSATLLPGSVDLPGVVELVDSIGGIDVPRQARDWAETRWDRFATSAGEAAWFQGDALLHTDVNPSNLLVGERRLWLVDWSWPTRGAGFIDPAILALQLIASGHSPAEAESWAAQCKAWGRADRKAIDAFVAATARMYLFRAAKSPDASWLAAMVVACRAWCERRGVRLAE